jgi:hypothetical protein
MPAYYVNWGRDTQLAGQVLLPVALALLVKAMLPGATRRDLIPAALCVAGLVVVHYRILIFYGLFGLAFGGWQLLSRQTGWRELLRSWARGLAVVSIGLAIASPWLVNLVVNYFPGLGRRLSTVTPDYLASYNDVNNIIVYVGRLVALLAAVGLAAAVFDLARSGRAATTSHALPPHGAALVFAIWSVLLVASLWVVPGAIGSYTVAITLYIPLSALGGYGLGWLLEQAASMLRRPATSFALGVLAAAPLLAFALGTSHVADPAQYSYVKTADFSAFDWIRANVPSDARFLISSEFSYAGRAVTASDAGMWLPLLTGRNVSVPALSAWTERPIEPDFFTNTRTLAAYTQPLDDPTGTDQSTQAALVRNGKIAQAHSLTDPATLALMKQMGITHVYSGVSGGVSKPRLDILRMRRDSDHYRLVYFQDGVYVFEVRY